MSELLDRHKAVMTSWLALYYDEPIEIVRGEGRHVWDGDDNRYLDFFGGILTTMTGYSVPEVVEAIQEQAANMLHTSTLYLIEPMVELAEQIAGLTDIPDAKVFFTTSGTEANDAALLLATSYRASNQILAVRNSYHGRSFSAMAITGNALPFLLISWGQQRIDSGLAGILMAVMPLTTLVLAHLFVAGERLTGARAGGFLLGFLANVVLAVGALVGAIRALL